MSALRPINRRVPSEKRPRTARRQATADEQSVPPARPSRAWEIVRSVAGVVVVVGVACLVAWGARKYVTTSPRFAVQRIVVSGAKMRTAEEIAAKAGIAPGDNVFLLDLDRAQNKLAKDPWMARAALSRRLPGTVIIDVDERQAAAIVAAGETFLATASGEVFKKLEPGDPDDLIVVTGIEHDAIGGDPEGTARTVRRALDLAGDYDSSRLSLHGRLQEVHVGTTGVSLIIGKNGLEIVLGAPPYRRKLEQAARVLAELSRRSTKPEVLLLDNDTRPDRVVARVH